MRKCTNRKYWYWSCVCLFTARCLSKNCRSIKSVWALPSEAARIDNRWVELRWLAWRETAAGKSVNQASLADSAHWVSRIFFGILLRCLLRESHQNRCSQSRDLIPTRHRKCFFFCLFLCNFSNSPKDSFLGGGGRGNGGQAGRNDHKNWCELNPPRHLKTWLFYEFEKRTTLFTSRNFLISPRKK